MWQGLMRLFPSALFLLITIEPAWAGERRAPLIQLQGEELVCTRSEDLPFGPVVCVEGNLRERTVSIFRNARAIAVTTDGTVDRDLPAPTSPAASTIRDGSLTTPQIQQLNAFLARISIANRRGGCNPFRGVPGRGEASTASYTIFWYSSDGRRTTVRFGTDSPRACPAQILELFEVIVGLGELIH